MTALFIFAVAVILAVLIARYNESNKLFKILFCSLLIGMACGAIAIKFVRNNANNDDKNNGAIQVAPTQESPIVVFDVDAMMFDDTLTVKANPVSKDSLPDSNSVSIALSKCFGEIRAQPNNCSPFNKGGPLEYFDSG